MTSLVGAWRIFGFLLLVHITVGHLFQNLETSRRARLMRRLPATYMSRVKDFEVFAEAYMDRHAKDYYNSGAGEQQTLKDNREAFARYRIRPRLMRDVSLRNMSLKVLGQPIRMPVGVSPVAFQKMAHPDGELGTAKAVCSAGGVMILSMLSTTPLEILEDEVSAGCALWLQVYVAKDREITRALVRRADAAGFKAIVITVDSPVNGMWGVNMVHNLTLPEHIRLPNLVNRGDDIPSNNIRSAVGSSLLDPGLTWKDIQWLRTFTAMPIVAKGILTAEDAILAVEHGASAILVSNHGGRQLDGVSATLDVLPEVVAAVQGRGAEVYMDGGVRTGSDVFKAIALGARAVFFGRPLIWGLVHSGQQGVESIFRIIKDELDTTMALAGAAELRDIRSSHVTKGQGFPISSIQ